MRQPSQRASMNKRFGLVDLFYFVFQCITSVSGVVGGKGEEGKAKGGGGGEREGR